MSKKRRHRSPVAGAKLPIEVIRQLIGRRTSNAAGKHGKRSKDRYNTRREAIRRDQDD